MQKKKGDQILMKIKPNVAINQIWSNLKKNLAS
jgi:hypothetical protein